MGSQRVRHNWAIFHFHFFTIWITRGDHATFLGKILKDTFGIAIINSQINLLHSTDNAFCALRHAVWLIVQKHEKKVSVSMETMLCAIMINHECQTLRSWENGGVVLKVCCYWNCWKRIWNDMTAWKVVVNTQGVERTKHGTLFRLADSEEQQTCQSFPADSRVWREVCSFEPAWDLGTELSQLPSAFVSVMISSSPNLSTALTLQTRRRSVESFHALS